MKIRFSDNLCSVEIQKVVIDTNKGRSETYDVDLNKRRLRRFDRKNFLRDLKKFFVK